MPLLVKRFADDLDGGGDGGDDVGDDGDGDAGTPKKIPRPG